MVGNDVSKIVSFVILFILLLLFSMWFLTSGGKAETQYGNAAEDLSPACGGWQSLYLCEKACYSEDKCDTTYCNAADPADSKSDTCSAYLEKMKKHAIVEVSPATVTYSKGSTVPISITVTDQDKKPISSTVMASGAGTSASSKISGTGTITISLVSKGIIKIKVTPDESSKLSNSYASVVVK